MEKKIIKYKTKKKNLEKKIIDILNLKKEKYENDIIDSNNENIITSSIENFFCNLTQNIMNVPNQLFIIVFGSYSVGKTTFISHLENYIEILEKINLGKTKTNLIMKILIKNNIENFKNIEFNLSPQIIIIECNINLVDKLNLLIQSENLININIIPKNKYSLKNKLANKIISDIKNKLNEFEQFINLSLDFTSQEKNNTNVQIDLLRSKKNILTYKDFDFLDNIVNLYYDDIVNNKNLCDNQTQLFKVHNFYL